MSATHILVTEWYPIDSFECARGTVYTGGYPFKCSMEEASGRLMTIDGKLLKVVGVEWDLVHRPKFGTPCGILTAPV